MDCHDSSLITPNRRIIRRQELDRAENAWKKLEGVGEKQEQTVRRLETTAMLLVGSYVYLQSLIFQSVSRMPCEFWWAPFSLSCLICVVFAIPFKSFVTKWERTQRYYEINFLKEDLVHLQIVVFSPSDHDEQLERQQQPAEILRNDAAKMYQRRAFICLVSLALVAYTIVVLTACRSIPCQRVAIL
ncbi:uncharacterized protein LOC126604346 [Malus sylvestris]|uniref:uncharacterized protein LOC126604346 n=1 Tax=Malus sylvestris TaxID=3752 RepID=UPI00049917E4|nr:uncharacterized protein LOC103415488 [Malus domestica]XP_050127522.1 uncharacterized protein LOC126604346 [Malus sylvestris]